VRFLELKYEKRFLKSSEAKTRSTNKKIFLNLYKIIIFVDGKAYPPVFYPFFVIFPSKNLKKRLDTGGGDIFYSFFTNFPKLYVNATTPENASLRI
jgi:hypothetical protein